MATKNVLRNVAPFYRVGERKCGGLEGELEEVRGQDEVEDREESNSAGLSCYETVKWGYSLLDGALPVRRI